MKNKEAFTLIELLAVIVILSVIAIITIPVITTVVEGVKKSSYKESLKNIFNVTELYIATNEFSDFPNDGLNITDPSIQMKNKSFTSGKVIKNEQGLLELDKISNGEYCGSGTIDNIVVIEGSCDSLDTTPPTINIYSNLVTNNSVTIVADGEDLESGINGYQYSKDNGVTWTNKQTSNVYTFTGLTSDTSYTFKVRVYNNNLLSTISSELIVTTNVNVIPTYSADSTDWGSSTTVTINFPERQPGYTYEYSLDGANTWIEVPEPDTSVEVTFDENGTVIARVTDDTEEVSRVTYVVTNIDTTSPVITVNPLIVQVNVGEIYYDTGVTASDDMLGNITEDIVITGSVNTSEIGSYTLTYNVSDAAGNAATPVSRTVNVMAILPIVTIDNSATDITANSASINGNVTSDGGDIIIERGFVYSTSQNPTIINNKKVVSGTTGDFSAIVNNLGSNTSYYIRAYATNGGGTGYSNEISFTTTSAIASTYGGTSNEEAFFNVTKITDGYISVGYSAATDGDLSGLNKGSADATIVKYNTSGNIIWKRNFGGTGAEFLYAVAPVADGYTAVGFSTSNDGDLYYLNKGSHDAVIVKYNTNGSMIWRYTFGGSSFESFQNIIATSDGYVTVGQSNSNDGDLSGMNHGDPDGIIVKYNTSGSVSWRRTLGGSNSDQIRGVYALSDGYIVVGYSSSNDGDLSGLNKGGIDAFIAKYNTSGSLLWIKTYGGTGYDLFDEVLAVSDGYIATGFSESSNGDLSGLNKGGRDAIIVKYDLNGNVIWKKNYGGSGTDDFSGEIVATTGGYLVAGYSSSTNGDSTGYNRGGSDGVIVKYDLNGNVVWKNYFGGTGADTLSGLDITVNGYVTVGDSNSNDGDLSGLNKGATDSVIYINE